jgi:hypothetical protein
MDDSAARERAAGVRNGGLGKTLLTLHMGVCIALGFAIFRNTDAPRDRDGRVRRG